MTPLHSIIERIIQTAISNPAQATTMLAQLHCQNIALCEYRTKIVEQVYEDAKDINLKGTLFINIDVDPEIQVYYHLLDRYRVHPKEGSFFIVDMDNIIVSGIDEWENKTRINIITDNDELRELVEAIEEVYEEEPIEEDERSNDNGSEEVDLPESGEDI